MQGSCDFAEGFPTIRLCTARLPRRFAPRNDTSGEREVHQCPSAIKYSLQGGHCPPLQTQSVGAFLSAPCTNWKCLPEIATGAERPRNDKSGAIAFLTLARTSRRCSVGPGCPLPYNARQKASCSSPRSILVFPLPSRSSSTHNITNIFVLWKKHKNPRGNPKRSLIIPSRRDLTNAGKCDKIKAQRESGAFKNTDPVFGIARQDRFVADRLGTPAFAAGAPFFFRRGREENQNV